MLKSDSFVEIIWSLRRERSQSVSVLGGFGGCRLREVLYHVGDVGARHLQHGRIGDRLGSFLSYGSALRQQLLHDLGGRKPLKAAGDKVWTSLF